MRTEIPDLARVVDIALHAGRVVMQYYGSCHLIAENGTAFPVTAADRAANSVITRELAELAPGIPVISEEGLLPSYEERRSWRRFWLIDPLDGTKEFISGNGEFTVNIALIVDGAPLLGVISAPAMGAVYFAQRGRGAWRQWAGGPSLRIHAAPPPADHTRVVESRSHPAPDLEAFLCTLGPVRRIRLGSSLKFCRIAEGEADLYPRLGPTMEWDVAAGDCIYRTATADGSERPSPLRYNQATLSTACFIVGSQSTCVRSSSGVRQS